MLKKVWIPIKNYIRHYTCPISSSHFLGIFPTTQCSTLSNGLTIATETRDTSSMCLGFYIGSGSRYEEDASNGFTHFFEHIAFKGSKTRAKAAVENDISKTGAKFRCFTTREYTVYYAECLVQDLKCVADILFDSVFNNAFLGCEVEFEKQIVYQEMLEHDVSTVNVLYDYLHSSAYQGTPLAQTIMGPSRNLYSLNYASLCDYVTRKFTPQRTVFAAVGNIAHEYIVSLGEQYLGHLPNAEPINIELGPKRYTGSETLYRNDSIPVAHVAIAVEGPSFTHENKLIMDLATSLIGGWDVSQPSGMNHGTRIANFVSSGGLCESYKAFNFHYQDTGLCGIEFISPRIETDDMVLMIQEEWMRLCHMVTDSELVRPKNELKTKLLSKAQTTTGTFHDIGLNVFHTGYRPPLYEQLLAIDNITADKLKKACDQYIYDRCPVIAGIGSTEGLLQYARTRDWMYWLRI